MRRVKKTDKNTFCGCEKKQSPKNGSSKKLSILTGIKNCYKIEENERKKNNMTINEFYGNKIIFCGAGKQLEVIKTDDIKEEVYKRVGVYYESRPLGGGLYAVAAINSIFFNYDLHYIEKICGDFFICAKKDDNLAGLSDKVCERIMKDKNKKN